MEHKQLDKCNKLTVKTAINARLKKLITRLTRLKKFNRLTALFITQCEASVRQPLKEETMAMQVDCSSSAMCVAPGGDGKWLRQSVDEFDGVVVLAADFIDEEVEQRQSRLVGTRVDQLGQRRHAEPHRVARVATLQCKFALYSRQYK